jgi:hypothetical protein
VNYCDCGTSDFYPLSKLFPNLSTFEYKIPHTYLNGHEDAFKVFELNNQLEILKLSGKMYGFDVLIIIKDYKNLTHLEYKCKQYDEDMEVYNYIVLPNVNHLYILAGIIRGYRIGEIFTNVTDLVIEYE